jgi:hypothetical protein
MEAVHEEALGNHPPVSCDCQRRYRVYGRDRIPIFSTLAIISTEPAAVLLIEAQQVRG